LVEPHSDRLRDLFIEPTFGCKPGTEGVGERERGSVQTVGLLTVSFLAFKFWTFAVSLRGRLNQREPSVSIAKL